MNDSVAAYRRALSRRLKCGRADKQRCLARFDQSLALFLEETPDPSSAQLEDAFGSPEQLAETYLHEIAPEVMRKYRRIRRAVIVIVVVLCCMLVAGSIYRSFFRPKVVTVEDSLIISEEWEVPD